MSRLKPRLKRGHFRSQPMKRRTLLRGSALGVAIGVPALNIMLGENGDALAQGEMLPKRFGVFFWGNGNRPDQWTPGTTGADYPLSPSLQPLAPVKDYVSVITGMNVMTGNERGHHAGTVGILSGAPMISQDPMGANFASTFSAPSIDQVVARAMDAPTSFRSLEYGISDTAPGSEGTTLKYLSHNGPDDVNPPEYSPRALFNRVFGAGFVNPGETPEVDPRLALRRSVLDAVMEDAADLRRRLGTVDRRRLDQHLTGIRALEERIALLETMPDRPLLASCAAPGTPEESYGRDALLLRNEVMSGVIAMALACDQTRVFSNQFSGSVANNRYPDTSAGHHGLTHDEGGDQPQVQAITRFIVDRFADLMMALQSVEEGDGTLLDRCVVLGSTDTSDARAHSLRDFPILIGGRGGGALRPGVHHRADGENTTKALLTCLQALGLPFDEFGVAGGRVTEAVTEVMS